MSLPFTGGGGVLYNPSPARSWLLFPPECGFREVLAWVLSPILGAFGNEGWRCYQEFICTDCYLISWQKASKHFFFSWTKELGI